MSYDKIYKDNIVSGAAIRDGKGNRIDTMYLSKDEFNTFNPAKSDLSNLTEGGLKVIKDNSGSGLEVCDIGMALYIDETKGLRRYLNGQIVDINANTQAFLNRLKEIQATNPDYFTTEDNWQAEALLNIDGCVYKFVLNYADDGETIISVRLPKYPDYVEVNAGSLSNSKIPVTSNQTLGSRRISIPCDNKINGTYKVVSQDGSGDVYTYGDFDKSIYWYANTSNIGINKTKLKLRYFIQIATGSETENNIVNDIELNNPYSLFDYKYSDHKLNNLSWLKSEGQWNAKAVYPDAYDKLLKVYNGTETVEGLSVKLSTEDYTNYDFVINTSDETFRLPLDTIDHPINSTGTLPVKGNGMTLGLTDGKVNVGLSWLSAINRAIYGSKGAYSTNVGTSWSSSDNGTDKSVGITTDSSKSGIVADLTSTKANLYLYYYVGETVQNANLIDAGRLGEQLSGLVEVGGSLSMPSSKFINLTLGASGSQYIAPANGWFYLQNNAGGSNPLTLINITTGFYISVPNGVPGHAAGIIIPTKKGDTVAATYNTPNGSTTRISFIYAQGDV